MTCHNHTHFKRSQFIKAFLVTLEEYPWPILEYGKEQDSD